LIIHPQGILEPGCHMNISHLPLLRMTVGLGDSFSVTWYITQSKIHTQVYIFPYSFDVDIILADQ
jgi:hypothetical protein